MESSAIRISNLIQSKDYVKKRIPRDYYMHYCHFLFAAPFPDIIKIYTLCKYQSCLTNDYSRLVSFVSIPDCHFLL